MTEHEFLSNYTPDKYQKPSVAVDILIFTINNDSKLELLLIKRGGYPFMGKWAVPGGFVDIAESLDDAAARELKEETGLENVYLEQLYTFGSVNRDPRTRVISVSYLALVPKSAIQYQAGDDAEDAALFEIERDGDRMEFVSRQKGIALSEKDLAFDHMEIVKTGMERLKNKIEYTDLAFELLKNRERFGIPEIRKIYEAVCGKTLAGYNFKRDFEKKYVHSGIVEKTDERCTEYAGPASWYYKKVR